MKVGRASPGECGWGDLAGPHLARYLFAADYARGGRVLDAGCGSGYGAGMLYAGGAAAVQAVDLDPEAIRYACQHFGGDGVEFLVDDCEELGKVAGPFDLICNLENIEHLRQPQRFLAAAARLLSPNGVLLVSTPDRAAAAPFVNGRPQNPFHFHEWYRGEFHALLATYFCEVEMRVQVRAAWLQGRIDAVAALRQGLMWSNPLLIFLWRKLPLLSKRQRPWKKLAGLAAPAIGDCPVVPLALAPIFGTSWFHVAVCRHPKPQADGPASQAT